MQTVPTIDPVADPPDPPLEEPGEQPEPFPDTPPETDPLAPGSSPEDEHALAASKLFPSAAPLGIRENPCKKESDCAVN